MFLGLIGMGCKIAQGIEADVLIDGEQTAGSHSHQCQEDLSREGLALRRWSAGNLI